MHNWNWRVGVRLVSPWLTVGDYCCWVALYGIAHMVWHGLNASGVLRNPSFKKVMSRLVQKGIIGVKDARV